MTYDLPDIPPTLRRDANNRAPFMMDLTEKTFEDALIAFRTQNPDTPLTVNLATNPPAPFMKPPHNRADLQMPVQWPDPRLSPAASLPPSPPSWVPPWQK